MSDHAFDLLRARADRLATARPSYAYLREHGIDFDAVEPMTGGPCLHLVKPVPPLSFDFNPKGSEAIVVEAQDEVGDVIDLVAWTPERPDRWRRLFGTAAALGMAAATSTVTYIEGLPLQLYRTPLEWLQASCDGAVLLDQVEGARWLAWLADLGFASAVAARDERHANEIDAARLAYARTLQRVVLPSSSRAA